MADLIPAANAVLRSDGWLRGRSVSHIEAGQVLIGEGYVPGNTAWRSFVNLTG
jgi:hypothetical protein